MSHVKKVTGGCACGAIRYEATGTPSNTMVCHCRTCRRVSGAPVLAWVTFDRAAFQFLCGNPSYYQSSTPVRRAFCSACGTPLTYQTEQYPATIDITTCTLDDPDAFPPTHHSWLSHDVAWVQFGDGLPAFSEFRS
jgi:hypothetical protein